MKVAIVGGSGGIGAALIASLSATSLVSDIHATYFSAGATRSDSASRDTSIHWSELDATDETSVAGWIKQIGSVDWIINCVGMLHTAELKPEKSIRQFDPELFQQSMTLNCLPTLILGKYAQSALRQSPQPIFATLSARVGSIEDNRLGGWHSYRASKAALNMALKCLAIEWQRTLPNARVLALHPGTTDTALSKPFQQRVPDGQLFSSKKSAEYLLSQIRDAHQHESGRFIAWDGSSIDW